LTSTCFLANPSPAYPPTNISSTPTFKSAQPSDRTCTDIYISGRGICSPRIYLLCGSLAYISVLNHNANGPAQRYLLPLLTHSYQARLALKLHQKDLLSRLTTSIESLKQTQTESFTVLPKLPPFREDPKYNDCRTLDQAVSASNDAPQEIPPFTVLRCAIEELAAQSRDVDTEELFRAIEAKLPWLRSEDGAQYQASQST